MTTPAPGLAIEDAWSPSPAQQARDAVRSRATRRSRAIALVSTLAVIGALVGIVGTSSGWPRTQQSFFSWQYAKESFPAVLSGLWLNLRVLAVCAVVVLVAGLLLAVARTTRGPVTFPLRLLAAAYTDLFRGLPLILVLLLVGFGVPGLRLAYVPNGPVFLGGVALCLTYTAYVAEVLRAGIESVHPSQRAAARSLGLTSAQTLRFVVLPQAVRRVVPPLLNDVVSLQKDSGLISVLGAVDAVRAAQISQAEQANFTPYVVAGVLFVLLTIPLTRVTDALAVSQARQRTAGAP